MARQSTPHRTPEERFGVIDVDVHPSVSFADNSVRRHLSKNALERIDFIGIAPPNVELQRILPAHGALRSDAWCDDGRPPGSDPTLAREQLLDAYGMSAAILNDVTPLAVARGTDGAPATFSVEIARACNDWRYEEWLASDPRWHSSINVCFELPTIAAAEVERCHALDRRFVQVLLEQRGDVPLGNQRYWPIYETAAELGLPIAYHVGMNKRLTGTGEPAFYFEDHSGFILRSFHLLSSLIFEGVFDRFPSLQVVLLEMGWAWAAPYSWRLDRCWSLFRDEVPYLQRKPSDYLKTNVWFGTQPMEDPGRKSVAVELYRQFERSIGRRLMFASDYPHWDFDPPTEIASRAFGHAARSAILGVNASELYGLKLQGDSGVR